MKFEAQQLDHDALFEVVSNTDDFLFMPGDFEVAWKKASELAQDTPVEIPHIKQAIIALKFHDKAWYDEKLSKIRLIHDRKDATYGQEAIDFAFTACKSQQEFKALLGLDVVGDSTVAYYLKQASVPIYTFLLDNFSIDEITILYKKHNVYDNARLIQEGTITNISVQNMRAVCTPSEQEFILQHKYDALAAFPTDRTITRDEFIHTNPDAHAPASDEQTYEREMLASLFSLPPAYEEAILKNGNSRYAFMRDELKQHLTEKKLQLLEEYSQGQAAYILRHGQIHDLLLITEKDLEKILRGLQKAYKGAIPWTSIYPYKNEYELRTNAADITDISLTALEYLSQIYDQTELSQLLHEHAQLFKPKVEKRWPVKDRYAYLEKLIGRSAMESVKMHDTTLRLLTDMGDEDKPRSVEASLRHAHMYLGQEKFLTYLSRDGGVYILTFFDLFQNISDETKKILFDDQADLSLQEWAWLDRDFAPKILKRFLHFSPKRQEVMVRHGGISHCCWNQKDMETVERFGDELFESYVKNFMKSLAYRGSEYLDILISRIETIAAHFGGAAAASILESRARVDEILSIPEDVIQKWDLFDALTPEEKQILRQLGLTMQVIKEPLRASEFAQNVYTQLNELLHDEPDLRNQMGAIFERFIAYEKRGGNLYEALQRFQKDLSNPALYTADLLMNLYLYVQGPEWLMRTKDPTLTHLDINARYNALYQRLLDVVEFSGDPDTLKEADTRNTHFASTYAKNKTLDRHIYLHGKRDFYPLDFLLGYRSIELLGTNQYDAWEDTPNAINVMSLVPNGTPLIDALRAQKDQIAITWGAHPNNKHGTTHIFDAEAVQTYQRNFHTDVYPGNTHGPEHMLWLGGIPVSAELCVIVNGSDMKFVDTLKMEYAKLPFYVPFLHYDTGAIVYTREEYHNTRQQLLQEGSAIDLTDTKSIDGVTRRLLAQYESADGTHGQKHIQNALTHVLPVCQELYEKNPAWFSEHHIPFEVYTSLVTLALLGHDLMRNETGNLEHALAGSKAWDTLVGNGLGYIWKQYVNMAIRQHNLPKEKRWSDDPITQALYDVDKADTSPKRGADKEYINMVLPSIETNYTQQILHALAIEPK